MVFQVEELAGRSLTGKTSNAFKDKKAAKPKLRNVENIIGKNVIMSLVGPVSGITCMLIGPQLLFFLYKIWS